MRGERPLTIGFPTTVESSSSVVVPATDLAGLNVVELLERIDVGRRDQVRQAPNGEDFHVKIAASTETLSRDNGIVPVAAWQGSITRFFPDNPVVLFAHNPFWPPIARAVDLQLKAGRNARMIQWWLFNDVTQLSQEVHALFEIGDLRAASVGFMLKAWHRIGDDELKKIGKKHPGANEFTWIADEAELVETSAVPTPADPNALVEGRSVEDDLDKIYAELGERYADGREVRDDRPVQVFLGSIDLAHRHGFNLDVLRRAYIEALERECAAGDDGACACLEAECSCESRGKHKDDKKKKKKTDDDEPAEGRGAIPFSAHAGSYAVAPQDAAWDAGKEVKAMAASKDSLRPRHAFVTDDADEDKKGGYKFPHHRAASNKAVVFRALAQGFARLDQASVSDAAKDGIARHLGKHYRDDYDLEPPERSAVAALVVRVAESDDEVNEFTLAEADVLRELGGCMTIGLRAVLSAAAELVDETMIEIVDEDGSAANLTDEDVLEIIDEPAEAAAT